MSWPRERQVLAGLAVVVAIGVAAFLVARPAKDARSRSQAQEHDLSAAPSKKGQKDKEKQPTGSPKAVSAPAPAPAPAPVPLPAQDSEPAVVVEQTPVDKKKEFDDANRIAQKYYKDQEFKKAAEYFTKCIELLGEVPEYESKMQLMYNNRSAMYEKAGELDKSLADITVLLALNADHDKSRIRRARIWERQGKLREALQELFTILVQRRNEAMAGKQVPDMTAEVAKIDELVEKVSIEELPAAKEAAKKNRGLPAKYLLKQFFASFKEYRELPQRFRDVKLETLVQGLHESRDEALPQPAKQAQALLDLALYYTSIEAYVTAFEMVQQAQQFVAELSAEDKSAIDRILLTQLQDTIATYLHLNNDLAAADIHYLAAFESLNEAAATHDAAEEPDAATLDRIKYLQAFVNLKYGGLLLDAGKVAESQVYYDRAVELDSDNMDVYVHRSQLWHSLKEPEKSQADLETAVTKDPTVPSCYIRLAANSLMSDPEQAARYMEQARSLAPNDANVASAEIEITFFQGDVQKALELADHAASLDPENPLPLISKAMILMQILQIYGGQLPNQQITHADLLPICDKILEIDPHNETAYSQKAQITLSLATSPAEMEAAVALFDKAIAHCRNPEDLPELVKYRTMGRAQVTAARST